MKNPGAERSRYKVTDTYRLQPFTALLRRDPDSYGWTWKGEISFTDGHRFSFASKRAFATPIEAEGYLRRFAHDRIDQRLDAIG